MPLAGSMVCTKVDVRRLLDGKSVYAGLVNTKVPSVVEDGYATLYKTDEGIDLGVNRNVWLDERTVLSIVESLSDELKVQVLDWFRTEQNRPGRLTVADVMESAGCPNLKHVGAFTRGVCIGTFHGPITYCQKVIARGFIPTEQFKDFAKLLESDCSFSLGLIAAGTMINSLSRDPDLMSELKEVVDGNGNKTRAMLISGGYGFELQINNQPTSEAIARPERHRIANEPWFPTYSMTDTEYSRRVVFNIGRGRIYARIHDDLDHFRLTTENGIAFGNGMVIVDAIVTDGDSKVHLFPNTIYGKVGSADGAIEPDKKQRIFTWSNVAVRVIKGQLRFIHAMDACSIDVTISVEALVGELSHKWLMKRIEGAYGKLLNTGDER